jgi:hypothetical protein
MGIRGHSSFRPVPGGGFFNSGNPTIASGSSATAEKKDVPVWAALGPGANTDHFADAGKMALWSTLWVMTGGQGQRWGATAALFAAVFGELRNLSIDNSPR